MGSKRRSLLVTIIMVVTCCIVIIIIIKFILDQPYRRGLPDFNDFQGLPVPLQEQISDASVKASHHPTSDNIGKLGMVFHSSAYYDEAAKCYELAVKKSKSNWLWSYYLGYLNQEMGESENAIKYFSKVLKENPLVYHAWYYLGEGYRNLGEDFKAELSFQKIVNIQENTNPKIINNRVDYFSLQTYAMFHLSRIYINSNRLENAEQTLKKIIQVRRSFGPAYRLLSNVYRIKGDSMLTNYFMIRANDLSDYSPPVDTLIDRLTLLSKSELYLLKQIDNAERSIYPEWGLTIAMEGLKQLPDNKYLISKVIKLLLKLGNEQQVLSFLQKHISLFKDDFDETIEVANLLFDKHLISQSLIYYNQAVNLKPENLKAQSGLALCLWESGIKENAISKFTSFIDKNDMNYLALNEAISFFIIVEEKEKANLYLKLLRKQSGSDSELNKFEGMIAEMEGRYNEAIAFYESSLKADPSALSVLQYLGALFMKQKIWDKSILIYKKALEYHPNEPDLLERMGTLLCSCPDIKLRDYNLARELSERAFIHKSSSPEVLISSAKSLAEAYWALGDQKNAISFMNIALNMAKSHTAPMDYIAELETRIKKFNSKN